ncbi:MAG: hypothetical protein KIY12_07585 [Thermoplasmata archaeon]|nr:hypothetical protein [Candidatus Sysuiplasma superficiale]MCL4347185.1 hypothetical protein [Candidatus Thermoplasmatota archaeon]
MPREIAVVACTNCGYAKVCLADTAVTECPHCGRRIDVRKAVKHFNGYDRMEASSVVFSVNAEASSMPGRSRHSVKGRDDSRPKVKAGKIEEFERRNRTFTLAQMSGYLEIGEEKAAQILEKLELSGRVVRRGSELYEFLE